MALLFFSIYLFYFLVRLSLFLLLMSHKSVLDVIDQVIVLIIFWSDEVLKYATGEKIIDIDI